jgi:hypothetical protein
MVRRCPHPMFKARHFDQEIIILCVRWYVTDKLSYCHDARARHPCRTEYDLSLGLALCARIRDAVESILSSGRLFLAR